MLPPADRLGARTIADTVPGSADEPKSALGLPLDTVRSPSSDPAPGVGSSMEPHATLPTASPTL